MRLFHFIARYYCAHENHEQGIIVSSSVIMQRMRMMRVILNKQRPVRKSLVIVARRVINDGQ